MSNPLLPRELCRFRIEADEIIIWERKMESEVLRDFIHEAYSKHFDHKPDAENEIQWVASIAEPMEGQVGKAKVEVPIERVVAYAYLHGEADEVEFSMIVHPDFRSQGLGTVMMRMATDLCIRHHKKVITVAIPDGAMRSTNAFGREGFDFVKGEGVQVGRREVR